MDSFDVMMAGLKFHERINRRGLEGLVRLMADDHVFIDTLGDVNKNMKEGWGEFFRNYPDYRSIITSATVTDNVVVMVGYSTCSNERRLNGPCMWTARVHDGRISEWRVCWLDER